MTKSEQIKALKLVLDNPANSINETSRDLIQLVITNIEIDMAEDAKTNIVSFVENYVDMEMSMQDIAKKFSNHPIIIGNRHKRVDSKDLIVIASAGGGIGKTSFAQRIAQDVEFMKKMNEEGNKVLILDTLGSGIFPELLKINKEDMIKATMIPKEYFGEEQSNVNPATRKYKSRHNNR
jgi:hypothetical protein